MQYLTLNFISLTKIYRQAVALFATILYLADWKIPIVCIRKKKLHIVRTNIFGQYPVCFNHFIEKS